MTTSTTTRKRTTTPTKRTTASKPARPPAAGPRVVTFTRRDTLTGRDYTGRGVVVADASGVVTVAPLADYTVQVAAHDVADVPAGE